MYTEQEAKTKDCPFFRYCVNEMGVIRDGDQPVYVHEKCRASACIMWRFDPENLEYTLSEFYPSDRGDGWVLSDKKSGFREERWCRNRGNRGYCGLAGKP